MSMKHFNDTIGNRTRDLPTCGTVPQSLKSRRWYQDGLHSHFAS